MPHGLPFTFNDPVHATLVEKIIYAPTTGLQWKVWLAAIAIARVENEDPRYYRAPNYMVYANRRWYLIFERGLTGMGDLNGADTEVLELKSSDC